MYCRAILLGLLCLAAGVRTEDAQSPRIIIVGAGVSGIAAATKLFENGLDNVLLLEAEDRIGGRVYTTKFDDYLVDLGAQWVHGEKGNVVNDLSKPFNLTDHSMPNTPFNYKTYTCSGEMIDPTINHKVRDLQNHIYDNLDMKTSECKTSVGDCLTPKYKEHFKKLPELNETLQNQFLWQLSLMETSLDPADSWFDIEMNKQLDQAEAGDLLINWKDRGYGTIIDILMKKFPNPEEELPVINKTMLNVEVTKVDYSNEDGTVKVTTNDGNEHTADHVIMTPSLGVLKADHETMFNPQLSEDKVRNIKGIGFGHACKIFLAFNDSWFNPMGLKNGGYLILWSTEEIERLNSNPKTMWMPYAIGFSFIEHKPNLMAMWVSGKGARLIGDVTDEEVRDQVSQLLHNVLSKDYNVTSPRAMIRSKWPQNKHFRGVYSYRNLETTRTNSSAAQLSEPIVKNGKPVVLFGGEATNPEFFATVHGAIGSGWREAERLINLHKKKTDAT